MAGKEDLTEVCSRFGLQALYAFGSRAGEAAAFCRAGQAMEADNPADLDVGVLEESGRLLSARERVHLSLALEDLFQVERVDLVVLAEVSAFLALDIIDGELLYVRDRDYLARYELYVLRRAGDLAPFERMRRKLLLQG
jgi:hypothetical protein